MIDQLEDGSCEGCIDFNREVSELQSHEMYWSSFEVEDVEVTPHTSPTFDYEIGYSFVAPKHYRPDFESGEMREVDPVEYTLVGGMNWGADGWRVGGLLGEWGPNIHD